MAEEAGLGVIGDVMAWKVLGNAALAGGLVARQIDLREEVLDVRRPDDVVPARDGGEEGAWVYGVEFIDIRAAPPVSRVGVLAEVVENLAPEAVGEGPAVCAEEEDAVGICGGALPGDVPGGVGAAVIVDVEEIAPPELLAEGVLHEVGFVFGQADSVDFQRPQSRATGGGNAMRQCYWE